MSDQEIIFEAILKTVAELKKAETDLQRAEIQDRILVLCLLLKEPVLKNVA